MANAEQGYLRTGRKAECFGCEACVQVCAHSALTMEEDPEGFRYPRLDASRCVDCGLCHRVCPAEELPAKHEDKPLTFGGYLRDERVREASTSGGAFSAIVEAWCRENYVIFGAEAVGLDVRHIYITDKSDLGRLRKSKYSQSAMGTAYADARRFLGEGRNVLFSGTPCQIAGLRRFLALGSVPTERLLTVEVVCEGVPSPWYMRKLSSKMQARHGSPIAALDYRYKDGRRWDYQVMRVGLKGGRTLKRDRWWNPFWGLWLSHLMSRPSCYACPFTTPGRVADITLGDLWGVHIYCPELYGGNGGASLAVANTVRGAEALRQAIPLMHGHELAFADALRYQSPMRKPIGENPQRAEFMRELTDPAVPLAEIQRRWWRQPSPRLLLSKYVWGNHRKVRLFNLKQIFRPHRHD